MSRRIVVFAFDFPYPAHRGGRADIWRRLLALKALGHEVMLVAWYQAKDGRPSDADVGVVDAVVQRLLLFPSRGGWRDAISRLLMLHRWPSHAAARRLGAVDRGKLDEAIRAFDPDIVWCEGPYPGIEAERSAALAHKPLVYRSHNIEHLYMARQAGAARRWRDRLAWRLACIGLARFERRMMDGALWIFDISHDDMLYWQSKGVQRNSWLPPLAEAAMRPGSALVTEEKTTDVAFLGNLVTPNNVRGVEWLVQDIVPRLRAKRPGTLVTVAGSNPGEHVRKLCEAAEVTLIANPTDALAIYESARVLVNPVRTGSGTHVKAIEMLMTSAPIVTATQGTCGMPEALKRLFRVADSADAFAEQVFEALSSRAEHGAERSDARRLFGVDGLAQALAQLPEAGKAR
jgi:hypothetical protein